MQNIIRVPVFRTQTSAGKNVIPLERQELVDKICSLITNYNVFDNPIKLKDDKGAINHEIVDVECTPETIGDVPIVFIRMSAHKTNIGEGYIKTHKTKKPITNELKIGSDQHFFIMYPMIKNNPDYTYSSYWIIFLYDDPYKNSEEFIRFAKKLIRETTGLNSRNLKKNEFLDFFEAMEIIPEIRVTCSTFEAGSTLFDPQFSDYTIQGKIQSKIEGKISDMPIEDLEQILYSTNSDVSFRKRTLWIPKGQKEIKVTQSIKEDYITATRKMTLLVESIFNDKIHITDSELKNKIFNKMFILAKLEDVVQNYLIQ